MDGHDHASKVPQEEEEEDHQSFLSRTLYMHTPPQGILSYILGDALISAMDCSGFPAALLVVLN